MATVKELSIVNYRSIGSDGVHILFPKASPLVLVGENNAGKSNIVSALELVLGERWPTSHEPEDHEFFGRARKNRICIDVFFEDSEEGEYGRGFTEVRYRYDPNSDGDSASLVGLPSLNPRYDTTWINGHDRDSCVCVLIAANRQLDYHLSYKSKYTFLSKLMRRFHAALLKDDNTKAELESIFAEIKETFHQIETFSVFVEELQESLNRLATSMTHRLEVDFEAYNPINFFQALRLQAVQDEDVRTLEELGTGEEQILAISFAHAYAKAFHGGILLVIEEPECHLHPIMQQWLATKIHEICADGLQIVITTHSPEFVDILNLDGIVLVRNGANGTFTIQRSREDLVDHCKNTGVPDNRVNTENILPFYRANSTVGQIAGFFAQKVVLVEGPTEKLALPHYLKQVGFDPLREGVEVISVDGKGNLAKWWRLLSLFDIPAYIIFDNDEKDDQSGNRRRDALGALKLSDDEIRAAMESASWLVAQEYCVFGIDFEATVRTFFSNYQKLEEEARENIGSTSKPFIARYVARHLKYYDNHEGWHKFEELAASISELSVAGDGHSLQRPFMDFL